MIYAESTRRAGRYAQRYRVIQPDGKTRCDPLAMGGQERPDGMPDRAVGIMIDDTEAYELGARARATSTRSSSSRSTSASIAIWRHDLRTDRMHYNDRALRSARPAAAARRPVARRGARADPPRRPAARASPRPSSALATRPADRHGGALPPRRRQLALRADAPRRRARRARRADRLRRRRARRDRAGRAAAPRRGAGAPPRGRVARRRRRHLDDDRRARRDATGTRRCSRCSTAASRRARRPSARVAATSCVHPDDRERVGARALAATSRSGDGAVEIEFRIAAPRRRACAGS